VNEKEANHPVHPMDRTANWGSHGGWFTLALVVLAGGREGLGNDQRKSKPYT
jgi:hypothetical protein